MNIVNNNKVKALIGTSGWMYNHWKGPLYPERFPNNKMLKHYVKYFETVEVNSTCIFPRVNLISFQKNLTNYVDLSILMNLRSSRMMKSLLFLWEQEFP